MTMIPRGDWRVRVVEDATDFVRDNVRVVPYVTLGDGTTLVLYGTVGSLPVAPEADVPREVGFALPRELMPAFIEGINLWQGRPGEPATEARVLREWLAVERARTERTLFGPEGGK